jgi:hypothetical protein
LRIKALTKGKEFLKRYDDAVSKKKWRVERNESRTWWKCYGSFE